MLSPILALFVLAGLSACSDRPTSLPQALPARSQAAKAIRFVDVAANVGLNFHHNRGLSSKKHFPETMGSGGGFIDFDGDGDLDIYAVNGNWIAPPPR